METKYRFATRDDISLILKFIRALAENEKMSSYVTCTEQDLERSVFDNGGAKIIFALDNEDESKEVGFAIFYYNFSTFMGKRGLYLEDLFVLPEYRGKGYGKALIRILEGIAHSEGCGRMEWCCRKENRSSVDFYLSLGARQMSDWSTVRFDEQKLIQDCKK